jgi:3-phenylpropionate/trans-cinnamate dioxygenase ferredoxin reductase subunit
MSQTCKVTINGELFSASRGDLLLDAALMHGIELPYECRAGQCGTCRVRVIAGHCLGDTTENPGIVHACQARIISDIQIAAEKLPNVMEVSGRVAALNEVAPDVVEVCIESPRRIAYVPGQYLSVRFRGFPARHYSPTALLDWPNDPDLIRFHVRRIAQGRVSSNLGLRIKKGHAVRMTGPFGAAHFRYNQAGRIVLVSSGTGFAPIWAIAEAAIRENPVRELVLIAGARTVESLYMIPALCRLALFPRVTIIPTVASRQTISRAVRHGEPIDYLPSLSSADVVYVAGPPALVRSVYRTARTSSAPCFADPFLPAKDKANADATFMDRAAAWLLPFTAERRRQGAQSRVADGLNRGSRSADKSNVRDMHRDSSRLVAMSMAGQE